MTQANIIAKQHKKIEELTQQVARQDALIKELWRTLKGSKSERYKPTPDPNVKQLSLFDTVDDTNSETEQETEETITYTRKKKKHPGRNSIPDHLPVEETVIEPTEDVQGMIRIGEEVTETIEFTPAKLVKKRLIRPKYLDPQTQRIYIAGMPSRPLPKGIAEAGLLAHITVSKYVDHLPLYRQAKMFLRDYKWGVPQSTLGGWVGGICDLLEPLYNVLEKEVLTGDYIQVDESPIKVLEHKSISGKSPPGNHKKIMQGYQWVYYSPNKKLVYFNYRPGRGQQGPKEVLLNYTGYVQCDGYQVYDAIASLRKDITLLGCLAHARRYFEKALDSDKEKSTYALNLIQKIYLEERKGKNLEDLEAHQQIRREKIIPKLQEIKAWIEEDYKKVLPKSKIGQAMYYYTSQWPKLLRAAEDARFHLDNNLIENKIRPLALGRKNYLFAGSHKGAKRAAMLYSFFGTCIQCNVNPRQWLKEVLEKIPEYPINKIDELLPNNFKLEEA